MSTPLDLPSILEALFLTASQQEGRVDVKGKNRLPGKETREIHEELLKAFSVFEGWPGNFHTFLDQVRSLNKSSKTNTGLISNFGGLYRWLYTPGRLSRSVSQLLRNEFEKYVLEYWDGGYLAQSKWFKASKFDGRYVSQRKACRELNLDAVVLERFVSNGKLKGVVRKNGGKRLFLVEAESIKQFKLNPSR